MSTKYQQEKTLSSKRKAFKGRFCPTCKNIGYILGPDETDHTDKMFIEECPECNSQVVISISFHNDKDKLSKITTQYGSVKNRPRQTCLKAQFSFGNSIMWFCSKNASTTRASKSFPLKEGFTLHASFMSFAVITPF